MKIHCQGTLSGVLAKEGVSVRDTVFVEPTVRWKGDPAIRRRVFGTRTSTVDDMVLDIRSSATSGNAKSAPPGKSHLAEFDA